MLDGFSSGADKGRYGAMKLRPLGPHRATKILCLKNQREVFGQIFGLKSQVELSPFCQAQLHIIVISFWDLTHD